MVVVKAVPLGVDILFHLGEHLLKVIRLETTNALIK
jgi:hypothetical protein